MERKKTVTPQEVQTNKVEFITLKGEIDSSKSCSRHAGESKKVIASHFRGDTYKFPWFVIRTVDELGYSSTIPVSACDVEYYHLS